MPKKPSLGILKEFRLEKSDGIGIHLELFKNSAAVCFSGKIRTGKVETYIQRKCHLHSLFFIFFIFYLVCFNFSSWHTILGFFLNCVKKIPNLFQNSCCNQGPIFNIYASFIHLYFFSVFSVVQFIVMSRGFVFVNLCNFGW